MTYDDWKTTPPDDDPEGEHQFDDDGQCPDCGAGSSERCSDECCCDDCVCVDPECDCQ